MLKVDPKRGGFEKLFKTTNEYRLHIELGYESKQPIFERNPVSGEYYHPAVALAWRFYSLGTQ